MPVFRKPLSEEQRKILTDKQNPSAEDIQQAQDALFMYLLNKVAELEEQQAQNNSTSPEWS